MHMFVDVCDAYGMEASIKIRMLVKWYIDLRNGYWINSKHNVNDIIPKVHRCAEFYVCILCREQVILRVHS